MTMIKSTILAATAVIAAALPIANAEAGKRRGGYHYSETFDTRGPVRGYEGFAGIGANSLYCSYIRRPVSRCYITRSGRERCRVVRWQLEQNCSN